MEIILFKCFKAYYYFLAYWLLGFISSTMDYITENKFYKNLKKNKNRNDYLNLFILNATDLLADILVLITNYRMKSEKEAIKFNNEKYKLIYNDLSIKENKRILIFSMNIIDLLGRSTTSTFYLSEQKNFRTR